MKGHFVFALVGILSTTSPSSAQYESISISQISLAEGLKAFDQICLANFLDEAAFQSSVQTSPLRFKRVDRQSRTHNKWLSQWASVIYVRRAWQAPMAPLPQCNMDFQIEPSGIQDDIPQGLDQTLRTRLNEVPPRKLFKFGIRWKWRQRGQSVQLFLIRNDRTKPGQVTLSLQRA